MRSPCALTKLSGVFVLIVIFVFVVVPFALYSQNYEGLGSLFQSTNGFN